MYREKKFKAIILAGGSGKRMESDLSKQYLPIYGRPMLYYSLAAFEKSPVDGIILVTAESEESYCQKELVEKYQLGKVERIITGGRERYHSTAKGLAAAGACDYVLIHDAARPCLSQEVILRCLDTVIEHGACTAGIKAVETIGRTDDSQKIIEIPNRNHLWTVQTPQCFRYADIHKAHQMLAAAEKNMSVHEKAMITDDVRIIQEYLGKEVYMAEGAYENIKVTTPTDLKIAELFLKNHS